MIKGALVMTTSGLVISNYGLEKAEFLSPLISAIIALVQEFGGGSPKSIQYGDNEIHIALCKRNKDIIVAIVSDSGDRSAYFTARRIASSLDRILSEEQVEVVTDEIAHEVNQVLESFLGKERPLMSFRELKDIAKEVYDNLFKERKEEFEEKLEELKKQVLKDEKKKIIKPKIKKTKIRNPYRLVEQIAKKFYSWNLYDAVDLAIKLAGSEELKDIGCLLFVKLGTLILQFPSPFKIIDPALLEKCISKNFKLPKELVDFVSLQVLAITKGMRDEFRDYVKKNAEALIEILNNAPEELEHAYATLFFVQSRTIFRTPLGDEIVAFLADKSELLYKLMLNERNVTRLFDMILAPTSWKEVRTEVLDYRLNYLGIREKSPLKIEKFSWDEKTISAIIDNVVALREYLMSILVAFESFGLSAKERKKLLTEAKEIAIEDVAKIVKIMPPLLSRVYYDIYSSSIYVLYYLIFLETSRGKVWIWREIKNMAQEGLNLFIDYLIRGRMTPFQFINYASPMAYMLGNAVLELTVFPEELLFYIKVISELDDETIKKLDSQVPEEKLLILIHTIMALTGASRAMLAKKRVGIIRKLMDIMKRLIDWGILNAKISREFLDDLVDISEIYIELIKDKDESFRLIQEIKTFFEIFIGNPSENVFEAAVLYSKLIELLSKYIDVYGKDDEAIKTIKELGELVIKLWEKEGFPNKAKEIRSLLKEEGAI